MSVKISRVDTAANFSSANAVYDLGEMTWEQDTLRIKVGDGVTAYNSLPYEFEGTTDHTALTNIGTNTHAQIDTHIADAGKHTDWSQASAGTIDPTNYVDSDTTDHTALSNIGTNTHTQIDTHIADLAKHVDWTQSGAGTIDPSNYVDNDTIYDDTAIQAAVTLNTAKVSADGPISTHSDVDTAGVLSGDQLEYNGTTWVPKSILNGFTIFSIWAEENAALANGQYEWSWGNGSTGAAIGVPLGLDCEMFAISFNAETFGTSVSIDTESNGVSVDTSNFTTNNQVQNITAVPLLQGDRIGFRTNTVVGTMTDCRVCAWFRVKATAAFPTPDKSVVSNTAVGFTSTGFATVPGMTTTVVLSDTGTIDATATYSAARSGGTNSEAQLRVVINGDNGQVFNDTLSTFNDTGAISHFVESLAAGTYTVLVQAAVSQPITITSIQLTANAVEN